MSEAVYRATMTAARICDTRQHDVVVRGGVGPRARAALRDRSKPNRSRGGVRCRANTWWITCRAWWIWSVTSKQITAMDTVPVTWARCGVCAGSARAPHARWAEAHVLFRSDGVIVGSACTANQVQVTVLAVYSRRQCELVSNLRWSL